MKNRIYLLSIFILLLSCNNGNESPTKVSSNQVVQQENSKGEEIILATIDAHGGDKYDVANYQFEFRDKVYTFKNNGADFEYTVAYEKDSLKVFDVLNNDGFTRAIGGQLEFLKKEDKDKYSESLNSVIYFATLPHKLKDESVNKTFIGEIPIKGRFYDMIEVTFKEDGGGSDFEDVYYYWVNQETHFIDYLAYSFKVNGGGVRFRAAFNPRVVDGIRFQDYVNFSAPLGTAIVDLPAMYENNELEELSIIGTDNVVSLSK